MAAAPCSTRWPPPPIEPPLSPPARPGTGGRGTGARGTGGAWHGGRMARGAHGTGGAWHGGARHGGRGGGRPGGRGAGARAAGAGRTGASRSRPGSTCISRCFPFLPGRRAGRNGETGQRACASFGMHHAPGSEPINPTFTVQRICFLNRRKTAGIVVVRRENRPLEGFLFRLTSRSCNAFRGQTRRTRRAAQARNIRGVLPAGQGGPPFQGHPPLR